MLIGYARVSKEESNITMQIRALEDYGCKKIFSEKKSGGDNAREQLNACLDYLRPGDTMVVLSHDRLSRDLLNSLQVKARLERENVRLEIIDMPDLNTPEGELNYHIQGAVSQFYRRQTSKKIKLALEQKKARGDVLGRPRALKNKQTIQMLADLHSKGHFIKDLMEQFDIKETTVHKYIREAKALGIYTHDVR